MFIQLLTNFGLVYTELGEYKDALNYHEHALDVSRIIFPTGHFIITRSLINIGIVYEKMLKYAEAIKYFEKPLENEEKKSYECQLDSINSNLR
jgi:tetratricopeptide (TPR) repeat protein